MRAQMTKIINGKKYNTETADIIASNEYWDGSNLERHGRNKHMYKTTKGAYFVGYSTQWQGELDYLEPIDKDAAKGLYEELEEHQTEYEEAFGETPEEA